MEADAVAKVDTGSEVKAEEIESEAEVNAGADAGAETEAGAETVGPI